VKMLDRLTHRWLEPWRRRLSQADPLQRADLIFVLAGHRNRKVYGARLLREGWTPAIVMSTGNPSFIAKVLLAEAGAAALRDSETGAMLERTARSSPPASGQFFACLDGAGWSIQEIPVTWFGTLSEITALRDWLWRHPHIRSLLVVSVGMHLKRLRMCCKRLLPGELIVRYIAVPEADLVGSELAGSPRPKGSRQILLEWAKILLYKALLLRFAGRNAL
jgi:hypothetical protein